MKKNKTVLPEERIFGKIYVVRGLKVMTDFDLASLYGVETRILNQAVRRNIERFPSDFMFELKPAEWNSLRSQFVILENRGKGEHSKYIPSVFTEQGVSMLSSVLKSKRAIAVNIQIMRIFTRMRRMIAGYKELLEKIEKLESSQGKSNKYIENIYSIIKELLEPAIRERKPIGFKVKR